MLDLAVSHSPALSLQPAAVWPLPNVNGRAPAIVAVAPARTGIDLAYAREHDLDLLAKFRPGTSNGTATHFMPNAMPTFSVSSGVVAYAGKLPCGYTVLVDHENGWATYYGNLEHMFVMPTSKRLGRAERANSGDVLGHVGASEPDALKCLRFELWRLGEDRHYVQVDPTEHMKHWLVLPWTDDRLTPTAQRAA